MVHRFFLDFRLCFRVLGFATGHWLFLERKTVTVCVKMGFISQNLLVCDPYVKTLSPRRVATAADALQVAARVKAEASSKQGPPQARQAAAVRDHFPAYQAAGYTIPIRDASVGIRRARAPASSAAARLASSRTDPFFSDGVAPPPAPRPAARQHQASSNTSSEHDVVAAAAMDAGAPGKMHEPVDANPSHLPEPASPAVHTEPAADKHDADVPLLDIEHMHVADDDGTCALFLQGPLIACLQEHFVCFVCAEYEPSTPRSYTAGSRRSGMMCIYS